MISLTRHVTFTDSYVTMLLPCVYVGSVKYRAAERFFSNMNPKIASQSWLFLAA